MEWIVRWSRAAAGAVIATVTAASTFTVTGVTRSAQPVMLLGATGPVVRYVALGDSYAAGTGTGAPGQGPVDCERNTGGYPELWAALHGPASFSSQACAGATTTGVIQHQLTALTTATTLVSVTAGGNDAGFSHVIESCVLGWWDSTCLDAISAAETFTARTLPARLDILLQAIRVRAPAAKIVVVGYPDLYDLSRSASCPGLTDTSKRTALNHAADSLDGVLAAAASRNGDVYADVRGQFTGHGICDSNVSWLNAVTFPVGDSYHPTADGQQHGYLPEFTDAVNAPR